MSEEEPTFYQVFGGWAAAGKGWAVHGQTQAEALHRFQDAQRLHREIDELIALDKLEQEQSVFARRKDP